jgi:predicted  nucleic acid-binding Zn-ribbon protein
MSRLLSLETKIKQLNSEIRSYEARLRNAQNDTATVLHQLTALQRRFDDLQHVNDNAADRLATWERRHDQLLELLTKKEAK